MPSSQENRRFYIRSPDFEFVQHGPIKIGNIITDIFLPQDPIAVLDPPPKVIQGAGYGAGKRERENHASVDIKFSTKLYQAFGGQAEAKDSKTMQTVYDFDEIQAFFVETNPTLADAKALRERNEEVRAALNNGPVYIVTGLKIAKGLRYSNRLAAEMQASMGGGGHITGDATAEGNVERAIGGMNNENWPVLGDPILAYRLHIIKKKSWQWKGEVLETNTYDPKDAGFMNRDERGQQFEVETEEVTQNDVKYFADEEEYKGVQEIKIEDEGEAWSLLCLER